MKIGELARLAGSNAETIRYYEREGLLPKASRSESNYRIYTDAHLERLTFIRHCRNLDMTLGEIRTLLHFKASPEETRASTRGSSCTPSTGIQCSLVSIRLAASIS